MAAINEVVRKCKEALESHYGSQFKGLILYGSEPLISARPVSRDEFEHRTIQLYRNAKRAGVLV